MSSEDMTRIHLWRKTLYKWTGLSDRTLWDWLLLLGILAIPLVLVLSLIWFSAALSQTEISLSETISGQQRQASLQIAKDQEQEIILDTYLDRMSTLILTENLNHSQSSDEVRQVARDRTLATLLSLDGVHRGAMLQFLYQSGLIMKGNVKVSLFGANLSGAKLRGVNLSGADLSGANLSGSDLTGADLSATVLIKTNLQGATMPDGSTNT